MCCCCCCCCLLLLFVAVACEQSRSENCEYVGIRPHQATTYNKTQQDTHTDRCTVKARRDLMPPKNADREGKANTRKRQEEKRKRMCDARTRTTRNMIDFPLTSCLRSCLLRNIACYLAWHLACVLACLGFSFFSFPLAVFRVPACCIAQKTVASNHEHSVLLASRLHCLVRISIGFIRIDKTPPILRMPVDSTNNCPCNFHVSGTAYNQTVPAGMREDIASRSRNAIQCQDRGENDSETTQKRMGACGQMDRLEGVADPQTGLQL